MRVLFYDEYNELCLYDSPAIYMSGEVLVIEGIGNLKTFILPKEGVSKLCTGDPFVLDRAGEAGFLNLANVSLEYPCERVGD